MPWLDPARRDESAEDRQLRDELRELVGYAARPFESNYFGAEATPEMMKLADRLRDEALRRRNTARQRPLWMLVAAGLPVALLLSGLSFWGVQQKRRADDLARTAAAEKIKAERSAESSQATVARDREGRSASAQPGRIAEHAGMAQLASARDPKAVRPGAKGTGTTTFKPNDYPVIEVKQPLAVPPAMVDRVKAQ